MYSENENPVFAPWTPNGGGGPPCLWEFEGRLYEHRWLEPNVSFLRKTLTVESVRNLLPLAASHLAGEPEHSVAILAQEDFPLCEVTVATRCAVLPQLLETSKNPVSYSNGRQKPLSTEPSYSIDEIRLRLK